jgi:cation:H+ antiporter
MISFNLLIFVLSLFLLYRGATYVIEYSSKLASQLGVTPIVIALSIVAFGTSAPELVASLTAIFANKPDLVMGNSVGSNIANIALIIAASAIVRSIKVESRTFKRQIPFFIGAALLLLLFSLDSLISRNEGFIFLLLAIFFNIFLIRQAAKERVFDVAIAKVKAKLAYHHRIHSFVLIAFGLVMLIIGARFLVSSASAMAINLGVTQAVIGITIIAIGTSLPELVTSLLASFKKNNQLIIGTVIGSNVLNVFLILGLTAMLIPIKVDFTIARIDLPIMVLFSLIFVTIIKTKFIISRTEGLILLAGYFGYVFYVLAR